MKKEKKRSRRLVLTKEKLRVQTGLKAGVTSALCATRSIDPQDGP